MSLDLPDSVKNAQISTKIYCFNQIYVDLTKNQLNGPICDEVNQFLIYFVRVRVYLGKIGHILTYSLVTRQLGIRLDSGLKSNL